MVRMVRRETKDIAPDEIFLDSTNLMARDEDQLEGRVEKPVPRAALLSIAAVFVFAASAFAVRALDLQVVNGDGYAKISRENRLDRSVVFAPRGLLYDRQGTRLAWNDLMETSASSTSSVSEPPPARRYIQAGGFSHILGFVRYPKADARGEWWREEYVGVSGAEYAYDDILRGENGSLMTETDARGDSVRSHLVEPVKNGEDVTLSIDADIQAKLFELLSSHARRNNFQGGASVIMDIHTGEIIAMVSFPEYDNAAFAEGSTQAVRDANNSETTPLLNRVFAGAYTPGSIVKPIFAAAALAERLIDPAKRILSTGELHVPNPYDPEKPSIFKDWKAHGWVNMREAIAVSSDVYFYVVGGGFGDQKGLGIAKIDEYAKRFGLGVPTGVEFAGEVLGVIPTPEWKRDVFDGDPWRLGDTYNTAIGQYGFQITPMQAVRYTAAVANGGSLVVPRLTAGDTPRGSEEVGVSPENMRVIQEGMRMAVSSYEADRTAKALDMPALSIAAKTGTAQLGVRNQWMNSWAVGFWPYENPRYAFATLLEKAPAGTLSGASPGMRPFFEWLIAEKPAYASQVAVH